MPYSHVNRQSFKGIINMLSGGGTDNGSQVAASMRRLTWEPAGEDPISLLVQDDREIGRGLTHLANQIAGDGDVDFDAVRIQMMQLLDPDTTDYIDWANERDRAAAEAKEAEAAPAGDGTDEDTGEAGGDGADAGEAGGEPPNPETDAATGEDTGDAGGEPPPDPDPEAEAKEAEQARADARVKRIGEAMLGLDRNNPDDFTSGATPKPQLRALKTATGLNDITGSERDEIWEAVRPTE